MTVTEQIADELSEFRSQRAAARMSKENMIRLAVQHCGISQTAAQKIGEHIDVFLDGWLVAKGVKQSWRNR